VNLLPWLLDWPPRRGTVAVFLLLTAASAGTLVLFGGFEDDVAGDDVTVESADVVVRLNDDVDFPETNGSVQTCLASGTPGDSVSVVGDVTVHVPADRGRFGARSLTVEVSLAGVEGTTTDAVSGTGTEVSDVFWVFEDDETLSVGDAVTLRVRVRSEGETVAAATRNVTVERGTRSYDCEPARLSHRSGSR
jgi:hypothetical protein